MQDAQLYYQEPRVSRFLFASRYMAPFWAIIRIYLGWTWLVAGWGKVTNPAWFGSDAGTAIGGYLRGAVARSQGDDPTVSTWYAWLIEKIFLPNAELMSYVVSVGEVLIGLALILGFLTGLSAFLGGVMNFSFLLAGTLSTNPVMFILATWLVLAWRVAGYYGLDYWVLPRLGAPAGPGFGKPEGGGSASRAGSRA